VEIIGFGLFIGAVISLRSAASNGWLVSEWWVQKMCKDAIRAWFEILLHFLGELWESTNIFLRILGPREEF
jgi:hypothetical protein